MLAGYLPFEDDTMKGLFDKIENGEYDFPSHMSKQVKELISKMLIVDPKKRMKISEVMEDEWFKVDFEKDKSEKIVEIDTEYSTNAITKTKEEEKESTTKKKIYTSLHLI